MCVLKQWLLVICGSFFQTQTPSGLVACFAAAVLPVNYLALDFGVVLPNLHPNAAPRTVKADLESGGLASRCW